MLKPFSKTIFILITIISRLVFAPISAAQDNLNLTMPANVKDGALLNVQKIYALQDDTGVDISGNNQINTVNNWLKKPLSVMVLDEHNNPIPRINVYFNLTSKPAKAEGDEISASEVLTDEQGIASVKFRFGDRDGTYIVTAIARGLPSSPITFNLTARNKGWALFIIMGTIGGLGIFLFGMELSSNAIRKAARKKIKSILGYLTKSRLTGVIVGMVITVFFQSSSATTVLLISFVSAELMSLAQTIGVILGADIGTTITAQLIAFKLTDYALLIIGIGFILYTVSKNQLHKNIGRAILGFGFIFLGIKIMSEVMVPLRTYQPFLDLLTEFENPLIGVLAGAIFTALIQASAATVGIVITLASQGIITLEASIPIILGANIGTCITATLAGIKASREAKRVAIVHVLFKIGGVLIFIWWIPQFAHFIRWISPCTSEALLGLQNVASAIPRQVANAHTIFNLGLALIFFPLIPFMASIAERILPDKEDAQNGLFKVKYIEKKYIKTPVLALSQTNREITRMGEVVDEMLRKIIVCFQQEDKKLLDEIKTKDDNVDFLRRSITNYITKTAQETLSPEQSEQVIRYLSVVNELEHVGDVIVKNLYPLAIKKYNKQFDFSEKGQKEIIEYHAKILTIFETALSAFSTDNKELAYQVIKMKPEIAKFERISRLSHFERLRKVVTESLETGSVHMDIIANFKRINSYSTNITKAVIGDVYPRENNVKFLDASS